MIYLFIEICIDILEYELFNLDCFINARKEEFRWIKYVDVLVQVEVAEKHETCALRKINIINDKGLPGLSQELRDYGIAMIFFQYRLQGAFIVPRT